MARRPKKSKPRKVSALRTARYFAEHRERVDLDAFDRLMARPGGAPPREGDEA